MGFAEYKVPGGKLLRVIAEKNRRDSTIESLLITGDFFLHPEELLPKMEARLIQQKLEEASLTTVIQQFLESQDALLVGASPQDFAALICRAAESTDSPP